MPLIDFSFFVFVNAGNLFCHLIRPFYISAFVCAFDSLRLDIVDTPQDCCL